MKAFLALRLSMGWVEKAELEDYWAGFWPTCTAGFEKVTCRNRSFLFCILQIMMSMLRVVSNTKKPDKYGCETILLNEAKSGYVLEWSIHWTICKSEDRQFMYISFTNIRDFM